MTVWFEGEREIGCDIGDVKRAADDLGALFVGVVGLMPGLTSVELVDLGGAAVTIRTSEGLMERTYVSKRVEDDRVVVEFDERYQAGSKVTTTSHFRHEFVASSTGVTHRLVLSDVAAPGFLGFLYRTFGSSRTGNAFLAAYKAFLEEH